MAHPVMWFEVLGTDGATLQKFYGDLFEWTFEVTPPNNYGMTNMNTRGVPGGIGQAAPGFGPWVTFYVETPDVTGSLERAQALGGRVLVPRLVMPDVTLGVFSDPEGHVVGLVEARAAAQ